MTLTDLLPARLGRRERPLRKHRAPDEIERLQRKVAGAELLIKGLHVQLDDKDRAHEATAARQAELIATLEDDVRRLTAQVADEQGARAVAEADVEARDRWVADLEQQVAGLERRWDIGVLAEAAAAKTQEIPVITRVLPLHEAPLATTNPGYVPAWAVPDEPATT